MHQEDINKILKSEHHDPFYVLGPHYTVVNGKSATVVRVYNPEAVEIKIKEDDRITPMEKVKDEGLFEAIINTTENISPYQLEITYPNGTGKHTKYDPYCFPPVLSDFDMHLFSEGKHYHIYDKLGSHPMTLNGVSGVFFGVWAPNAKRVSVVGDFNCWDGRINPMRCRGGSGIWELFIPGLESGTVYKYEVKTQTNAVLLKSDPYAFYSEVRPNTASIVYSDNFQWDDHKWIEQREKSSSYEKPVSIYEVHLGSWMRVPEENNRFLTYRELADKLVQYVKDMGFTHIELLPVAEHPFDGSWGYQVTGYYAITSRYGTPEDFKYFINECHKNNIGVIVDWVPAHFPRDAHGLAWFDGTYLYEHADPRKGEHRDWGTLIFNYGRNEVCNFLIANALFLFEKYHIDGIRVDAVASILYLDYSRSEGEWIPNQYGGRENLEAISFLKHLNEVIYRYYPGVMTIAEESTAWPGVSRPTYLGGLGFALKWNMGWMNDILVYFSKDPIHRKYHQDNLTFALLYAFHENFILVLSHDEVVHGKKALLSKMPGDMWQQFANLRLLYGYMYGQPGKKLLFMGADIGQWNEWNFEESIEWHLLQYGTHKSIQQYLKALNHIYIQNKPMFEVDFDFSGFEWIDFHDTDNCVVSFIRYAKNRDEFMVFVYNCTPVPRMGYRIGVPKGGYYRELLNSDSEIFGGSNIGNNGGVMADALPWQWRNYSIEINLPPLGALIFKPE